MYVSILFLLSPQSVILYPYFLPQVEQPLTDESIEQRHLQSTLPEHQELEAATVRGNLFLEEKASQVSLFFYFQSSPFAG